MKILTKISLLSLALVIGLGLSLTPALAQEENELETPEPVNVRVFPDSPLYFLKNLAEKIQETFTFKDEAKLALMERLGEKRAIEAQKMIEKGKPELAEKVMNKYNQHLGKIERLIDEGCDKLDPNLERVQQRIENRFEIRNQTLQRVMENAPEQARPGLQRALENNEKSLNAIGQAFQKRLGNKEKMNQRLQQRLNNLDQVNIEAEEIEIEKPEIPEVETLIPEGAGRR